MLSLPSSRLRPNPPHPSLREDSLPDPRSPPLTKRHKDAVTRRVPIPARSANPNRPCARSAFCPGTSRPHPTAGVGPTARTSAYRPPPGKVAAVARPLTHLTPRSVPSRAAVPYGHRRHRAEPSPAEPPRPHRPAPRPKAPPPRFPLWPAPRGAGQGGRATANLSPRTSLIGVKSNQWKRREGGSSRQSAAPTWGSQEGCPRVAGSSLPARGASPAWGCRRAVSLGRGVDLGSPSACRPPPALRLPPSLPPVDGGHPGPCPRPPPAPLTHFPANPKCAPRPCPRPPALRPGACSGGRGCGSRSCGAAQTTSALHPLWRSRGRGAFVGRREAFRKAKKKKAPTFPCERGSGGRGTIASGLQRARGRR